MTTNSQHDLSPSLTISSTPKRRLSDTSDDSTNTKRMRCSEEPLIEIIPLSPVDMVEEVVSIVDDDLDYRQSSLLRHTDEAVSPPFDLLRHFDATVTLVTQYLDMSVFARIKTWLHTHVEYITSDLYDPNLPDAFQRQALDNLGRILCNLMLVDRPFPDDIVGCEKLRFHNDLQTFCEDITTLTFETIMRSTAQTVLELQQVVNGKGQAARLWYLELAVPLMTKNSCMMSTTQSSHSFNFDVIDKTIEPYILQLPKKLHELMRQAISQPANATSWTIVASTYELLSATAKLSTDKYTPSNAQLELVDFIRFGSQSILPLCLKEPRVVSQSFFESILRSTNNMCMVLLPLMDNQGVRQVFSTILSNIPGWSDASNLEDILSELDSGQQHELLCSAQRLCMGNCLLQSNVMTIKCIGLRAINWTLQKHSRTSIDALTCLSELLKRIGIVSFIYGPQAHATVLRSTQLVTSFIADAGVWDLALTDLLWRACTTRQEDTIIDSAFNNLQETCRYLNIEHLMAILERFRRIPVEQVSSHMSRFLDALLRFINTHSDQSWRYTTEPTTPQSVCVDMLSTLQYKPHTKAISSLSRTGLSQLVSCNNNSHERAWIIQFCADCIKKRTWQATLSCDILRHYLIESQTNKPGSWALSYLSCDIVIASLQHLEVDNQHLAEAVSMHIKLAALLVVQGQELESHDVETFWAYTIGEKVPQEQAVHMFDYLVTVLQIDSPSSYQSQFLLNGVRRRLETLKPSELTKRVLEFIHHLIQNDITTASSISADWLARHEFWSLLQKHSILADETVWQTAISIYTEIILQTGVSSNRRHLELQELQIEFVEEQLTRLIGINDTTIEHQLVQRIFDIFEHILRNDETENRANKHRLAYNKKASFRQALQANYDGFGSLLSTRNSAACRARDLLRKLPVLPAYDVYILEHEIQATVKMLSESPWLVMHMVDIIQQRLHTQTASSGSSSIFSSKARDILIAILLNQKGKLPLQAVCDTAMTLTDYLKTSVQSSEVNGLRTPDTLQEVDKSESAQDGRYDNKLCLQLIDCIYLVFAEVETTIDVRQQQFCILYSLLLQLCCSGESWQQLTILSGFRQLHKDMTHKQDHRYIASLRALMVPFINDSQQGHDVSYIDLLLEQLSGVLARQNVVSEICYLINQLLPHISPRGTDQLRSWFDEISTLLEGYQHCETTTTRLTDYTIVGLLQLMCNIARYLQSAGASIADHQLAIRLFDNLLFFRSHNQFLSHINEGDCGPRQLLQSETRKYCYELVYLLSDEQSCTKELLERLAHLLESFSIEQTWSRSCRAPWLPAGLINLGTTCYMNALLQQIFANSQLREGILNIPIIDTGKQALLVEIQKLFVSLQDSAHPAVDTTELAKAMNINVSVQDDVHTYYTILISAIEESILDADERARFMQLYTGKCISQIRGQCGHLSTKSETFNALPMTVQDTSGLEASLQEYFEFERLEGDNRYECTTCETNGRLVTAVKRTTLDQAPDVLTICLKRCAYSATNHETKNNDTFHFPEHIDLACYQQAHQGDTLDKDIFVLTGVVVHTGDLTWGHYWSFVRRPGNDHLVSESWTRFEDSQVDNVSFEKMYAESVGGMGQRSSAYMLFYERKHSYDLREDAYMVQKRQDVISPPRVLIPRQYMEAIESQNQQFHKRMHFLHPSLWAFIVGMIKRHQQHTITSYRERTYNDHNIRRAFAAPGKVLVAYTDNILRHMDDISFEDLKHLLLDATQCGSRLAEHFLDALTDRSELMMQVLRSPDNDRGFSVMLCDVLRDVKRHLPTAYLSVFDTTVDALWTLSSARLHGPSAGKCWLAYFRLLDALSGAGDEELDIILSKQYICWSVQCMQKAIKQVDKAGVLETPPFEAILQFVHCIIKRVYLDTREEQRFKRESYLKDLLNTELQEGRRVIPWLTHSVKFEHKALESPELILRHLLELDGGRYIDLVSDSIVVSTQCQYFIDTLHGLIEAFANVCGDGHHTHQFFKEIINTTDGLTMEDDFVTLMGVIAAIAPHAVISVADKCFIELATTDEANQQGGSGLYKRLLQVDEPFDHTNLLHTDQDADIARIIQVTAVISKVLSWHETTSGRAVRDSTRYISTILIESCAFADRVRKHIEWSEIKMCGWSISTDEILDHYTQMLFKQSDIGRAHSLSMGKIIEIESEETEGSEIEDDEETVEKASQKGRVTLNCRR